MKIDGLLCFDKKKIADETKPFYTCLFAEEYKFRPAFDSLNMPSISMEDSISLKKPFIEEEVKSVIDHFGANKSPGPDGFTMEFYKHAWEVIKQDLMLVVKEFESTSMMDWRPNCTNINLIPKCSGGS